MHHKGVEDCELNQSLSVGLDKSADIEGGAIVLPTSESSPVLDVILKVDSCGEEVDSI